MTDYLHLRGTAEKMQSELETRLDSEWFGATEYNRIRYKIERLKMFQEYLRLTKEFNPPMFQKH